MKGDLKDRAVKGISWNLIENISSYIIKFFIGIILARLLTPGDYGLIGIAMIFFSIAEVFITSGFGQAYIRIQNASQEDANTVFITNFVLSLIAYVLFWFTAPSIAVFFDQQELTLLIRVMAIIVVINSLNIIQLAIIRKNLDFKRKTLITLFASLLSGLLGIYFATRGYGVWSLVIQQISSKLIVSISLYSTSEVRLRLSFSRNSFTKMFNYGSWLLLSNIIIRFFDNLYRFIIGKFFSANQLGLFDRGQQFPSMIYQQFSWSIGAVAFPVYAKLLDDKQALRNALLKFVRNSSLIVMPFLMVLFIIAEPFVLFLLTDKWAGAIIFIKLYCIIGILSPLYDFLMQFIEAIGRSKRTFIYTSVMICFRIVNVLVNLRFGIVEILFGEIAILLLAILTVSLLSKDFMGFNFLSIIYRLKFVYLSSIFTAIAGYILHLILPDNLIIQIFIPATVMFISYITFMYFFEKQFVSSVFSLIRKGKF
jgi:O-antigen/teichoic acid export membrane protein